MNEQLRFILTLLVLLLVPGAASAATWLPPRGVHTAIIPANLGLTAQLTWLYPAITSRLAAVLRCDHSPVV